MSMMKGAALYGPKDIRVGKMEIPTLGPGEALVKIDCCGICPSDVKAYMGNWRTSLAYPLVLGHEWVGEVVDVASDVRNVRPGDRVAACWRVTCGTCNFCRRGDMSCCVSLSKERAVGGFTEYGRLDASSLYPIPDNVEYDEACFAEPLACCINGQEMTGVRQGDDVAVIGAGPIGLLHVQLSCARGARVIAVDHIEERLAMALDLGAHDVICPTAVDLREAVSELTAGKGADRVIVAAGAASVVNDALDIVANCGVVNVFAGISPATKIELDPNLIHYRQVSLTGSHDFNPSHFQLGLKLLGDGIISTRRMISHRVPLDRIEEGFAIVADKRGAKVVIDMRREAR